MARSTRKKKSGSKRKGTIDFPCITFKQGKHHLYAFVASGKALWQVVEINRRVENKPEGYQRALSESRAVRIGSFIDENNVLPNSVLVNFDEATVTGSGASRKLIVPDKPNAGWVIDGQHRIEGAYRSENDIQLLVVAFVGLNLEDQINCFVTINREQKGVPSSLYYELLKLLPGNKSETEAIKERAADLASRIKNDETSPFYQRIVVTVSPKAGQMSLTNFVRKLHPHLKVGKGRLAAFSDDEKCAILNNYYRALEVVFPSSYGKSDSVFFKTVGFGALINVLPVFLDITLQRHSKFRVTDAAEVFRTINDFDFEAWRELGTGNAAEIAAGEDVRSALQGAVSVGSEKGMGLVYE